MSDNLGIKHTAKEFAAFGSSIPTSTTIILFFAPYFTFINF